MKSRFVTVAIMVLLMTVGGTTIPSGRSSADIDGDTLDEIGGFAVEVTGSARGPWFQVFNGNGTTVLDAFLLNGWTGHKMVTIDIDGDSSDELVVLATRISDGKVMLYAYDDTGTQVASVKLAAAGNTVYSGYDFFPVNYNGGAAVEVAVVKERTSDGKGIYQVWSKSGASFAKQAEGGGTKAPASGITWLAADINADGNEEIVSLYTLNSTGAKRLHYLEPQTSTLIVKKGITASTFSNHQMVAGNFVEGSATGKEVAVVYTKDADDSIRFSVSDETGATLKSGKAYTASPAQHTLLAVKATGGVDQMLFGLVRGDGKTLFRVFDVTAAPTKIGSASVFGSTEQVVDWLVGNFDGNAANGEEIVVGYTRVSDGRIGFAEYARTGGARLANVKGAIPGTFLNAQFLAMRPNNANRDDVVIGVAHPTDQPRMDVWRVNGTQTLTKRIFNADVT